MAQEAQGMQKNGNLSNHVSMIHLCGHRNARLSDVQVFKIITNTKITQKDRTEKWLLTDKLRGGNRPERPLIGPTIHITKGSENYFLIFGEYYTLCGMPNRVRVDGALCSRGMCWLLPGLSLRLLPLFFADSGLAGKSASFGSVTS
jgi:hypothetical protein